MLMLTRLPFTRARLLVLTLAGLLYSGVPQLTVQSAPAPKKAPDDRECVISNGTTDAPGGARGVRAPGEKIAIQAKPPGKDRRFDQWVGNIEFLAEPKAAATTLTMPPAGYAFAHVHVAATYRSTSPKPLLHPLFAEHMVLQCDVPAPVWGWAEPGREVMVEIAGQKDSAKAGADGRWQARVGPLPAGGPHVLRVRAGSTAVEIKDVLIGDVWLCSGQSNMRGQGVAAEDAAGANYPQIRVLMENPAAESYDSAVPLETLEGGKVAWELCTPEAARHFSRTAHFFAEALHRQNHVPVGVIVSSYDGSVIEAWMPQTTLATMPEYSVGGQFRPAWNLSWGGGGMPAVRYHANIAPLAPFALRGVLWYQGESNANALTSIRYRDLLTLMIRDWRQAWGNENLPFVLVQLHSFGKYDPSRPPGDRRETWIELEESQLAVARSVPQVGCAVTVDLAKEQSLHPPDKKSIGQRAALVARQVAYGEKVVSTGPLYRAMTVEGEKVRIRFERLGGGLVAKGGAPLKYFAVAGEDHKWAWADAHIDGETVVVSSPRVKVPAAVRYAWGSGQQEANLFSQAGLPAPAFRTDRWTGEEKK
jgi:sialate O-acetylesterase